MSEFPANSTVSVEVGMHPPADNPVSLSPGAERTDVMARVAGPPGEAKKHAVNMHPLNLADCDQN